MHQLNRKLGYDLKYNWNERNGVEFVLCLVLQCFFFFFYFSSNVWTVSNFSFCIFDFVRNIVV